MFRSLYILNIIIIIIIIVIFSSPKDTISLLLDRVKKRGRERNIDVREQHWLAASHKCLDQALYAPGPGIDPQPRYVLWLGITPANFLLWDGVPPTESHQPRLYLILLNNYVFNWKSDESFIFRWKISLHSICSWSIWHSINEQNGSTTLSWVLHIWGLLRCQQGERQCFGWPVSAVAVWAESTFLPLWLLPMRKCYVFISWFWVTIISTAHHWVGIIQSNTLKTQTYT